MNSLDFQVGARHHFGTHEVWIDAPDIFGVRLTGPISGDELHSILAFQHEWARDKKNFFALCDVSKVGDVAPSTRKVLNQRTLGSNVNLVNVLYGASFAIRVLADMVWRARKVLRPNDRSDEVIFVATEEEARSLIEKRRKSGG